MIWMMSWFSKTWSADWSLSGASSVFCWGECLGTERLDIVQSILSVNASIRQFIWNPMIFVESIRIDEFG
jgi:hypothetical protein